jgi:hypothetical protein
MAKMAELFFSKMFQTNKKVAVREKMAVVTLTLSVIIILVGYFAIS